MAARDSEAYMHKLNSDKPCLVCSNLFSCLEVIKWPCSQVSSHSLQMCLNDLSNRQPQNVPLRAIIIYTDYRLTHS